MSPFFSKRQLMRARGLITVLGGALLLSTALPNLARAQQQAPDPEEAAREALLDQGPKFKHEFESTYRDADREEDALISYYAQYCEGRIESLAFKQAKAEYYEGRGQFEKALTTLTDAVTEAEGAIEPGFTKLALRDALAISDIVKHQLDAPAVGPHDIVLNNASVKADKVFQYLNSFVEVAFWTYDNLDKPYWYGGYRYDRYNERHRRSFASKMAEYGREILVHALDASALFQNDGHNGALDRRSYGIIPRGGPSVALAVIAKAAKWAASSLAHTGIGEYYGCEIADLRDLASEAKDDSKDSFRDGMIDMANIEPWARGVAYSITEYQECGYGDRDRYRAFREERGDSYKDEDHEHHREYDRGGDRRP